MRGLVWFVLGFGACCALGAYAGAGVWIPVLAGLLLLSFAGCVLLRRRNVCFRCGALALAGGVIGLGCFLAYHWRVLVPVAELSGTKTEITVHLTDDPAPTAYGQSVLGTIRVQGQNVRLRLYWSGDAPELSAGDDVQLTARLRQSGEGAGRYDRSNGILLTGSVQGEVRRIPSEGKSRLWDVPGRLRRFLRTQLRTVFPEDTAGFAVALLIGDRSGLSYSETNRLSLSGIAHVIAVSGMHVSILFGMLWGVAGKRRIPGTLLAAPALLLFAAAAGFSPSVTRAVVMQLLMLLSVLVKREYDPPTALAAACLVILACNPLAAASVSFQLSVGSIAGIFLWSRRLSKGLAARMGAGKGRGFRNWLCRRLAGSLSVTLGAQMLTAPVTAWYFGGVSLISVLTNLLTLWAVTAAFCGTVLSCMLGAFWAPLGRAAAWMTAWLIRYVREVSALCAAFPLGTVYTDGPYLPLCLLTAYGFVLWALISRGRRVRLLAGCGVLFLLAGMALSWLESLTDRCRVTVLDVGQGQCILLQSRGRTFVVDCGGSNPDRAGENAARRLLSMGITRIDGLILTHYDADHAGGCAQLLSRIRADCLYLPEAAGEESVPGELQRQAKDTAVIWVRENVRVMFPDGELRLCAPSPDSVGNAHCLAVLFRAGGYDTLITGDLDQAGERRLVALNALPEVDLLIVGHHGSDSSTSQALLQAGRPALAVISVGENRYGLPSQAVLDRLEAAGCKIFRTDWDGTVMVRR